MISSRSAVTALLLRVVDQFFELLVSSFCLLEFLSKLADRHHRELRSESLLFDNEPTTVWTLQDHKLKGIRLNFGQIKLLNLGAMPEMWSDLWAVIGCCSFQLLQTRLLRRMILVAIKLVLLILLLVLLEQCLHGCIDVEVRFAHLAWHVLDILYIPAIILVIQPVILLSHLVFVPAF